MIYFISKSDYVGYVDISQNIEDRYLEPPIRLTQVVDIKPILCNSLYNEFYTQYSSGTLSYANAALLPLVKEAMIYQSYARFIAGPAQFRSTPFGIVIKSSDDSQQIDSKQLADMISRAERDAAHFISELKAYVKTNHDINSGCGSCGDSDNFGTFNITKI